MAPPFANALIYAYTRAQALADGVLVDVSQMAREASFKFPTAITADLHARLDPNEVENAWGQSYDGRLWDVLWMASRGARKVGRSDRVSFQVILAEVDDHHPRKQQQSTLTLWCVIGPGDREIVLTDVPVGENFYSLLYQFNATLAQSHQPFVVWRLEWIVGESDRLWPDRVPQIKNEHGAACVIGYAHDEAGNLIYLGMVGHKTVLESIRARSRQGSVRSSSCKADRSTRWQATTARPGSTCRTMGHITQA